MASSARIKMAALTSADIDRLEGCAQTLVDTDPKSRPKSTAYKYIAENLGVEVRTAKEWVRRARPMARRTDLTDRFFCVYSRIASLLAEQLDASVWTTATTAGGRDALKAALFLLPRVDEENYGTPDDSDDATDMLAISDVPQAVFDAMTPEQLAELEQAQQQVQDAIARAEAVVKQAQAKMLTNEIAERQVH